MQHDSLQNFLLTQANVRGALVRLEKTYQTILNQRAYPPAVQHLLGEALMSVVLLAGNIQFEGSFSLQFQGDHRLPLLLVQCDHQLHLRALVKYAEKATNTDYQRCFLAGKMTLFVDQYHQTQGYQSIVPIHSVSMADNLSFYFAQSEQIQTQVWFMTTPNQAAGLLLQKMPGPYELEQEKFWNAAVNRAKNITPNAWLNCDNQTLLEQVYPNTENAIYSARALAFRCQCTHDKMKQVLTVLGKQDSEALLKENHEVVVNCDFCQQRYVFHASDIEIQFNTPSKPERRLKNI